MKCQQGVKVVPATAGWEKGRGCVYWGGEMVGNLDPLGDSSEREEARWVCDRKTSDVGIWRGHSR